MATQLLPLFPLSLVLLPGIPLPLHIFEERYKEMMADVIPAETEFGIVLAKDEGIVSVGCTAVVHQVVQRYSDGRLDLLAMGIRRFEIESLNEDKSYLRANVGFFDDDDEQRPSRELLLKVKTAYGKLLTLEKPSVSVEPDFDNPRLSFQLAQFILDADKRQALLTLRSEVQRLEYVAKIVPEYVSQREHMALAQRVAPLNGHAKHVVVRN
ncbi:MAG: LON peptidase substrate-binding domain-containing protein [Acidobacteriaceae bacterium]|nr:LON peptidase substrate-binding domain-containing protein [Acidobacteriaceae bacterium]